MGMEVVVVVTALALLMIDLWTPAARKAQLGYLAAAVLGVLLIGSFWVQPAAPVFAFNDSYVVDGLSMFFKRLFLMAGILVLIMSVDFADRISVGITEFYSITLLALAGMMFAASSNDFVMVFVSLELITVSFYVLNSFQRSRLLSLEAGIKYLIMGALSSAFMVFGIALVFGSAGTTNFSLLLKAPAELSTQPIFLLGLVLTLFGLSFKIAAFPFQIWAPDVYQGSPAPATAFLAIGSKAAGFVLLLRVLFGAVPAVAAHWTTLLIIMSAVTILYGNLCAIPQRNLKRLLGYSSIGNAGYLLLGVAAGSQGGSSAVLYYLTGYLFTVIAAFAVISILTRQYQDEDISILAGLHQRSPLLAATLTIAFVSLAGIPPLAGFFGKFLLIKSVVAHASTPGFGLLIAITIIGVVISFYYYLGVVRAIYWSKSAPDLSPIPVTLPMRLVLYVCVGGILFLGFFPDRVLSLAAKAVEQLHF